MLLYVFFLAGWMQPMSEAYSQTMCRTWTQIATTGAVTSIGEKKVWLPQMRVGYLYLFGEHEEAHGVSRKADGFRSRSVRHQWSGSLAKYAGGGNGRGRGGGRGGQQLWKLPSWLSRSIW